MTYSNRLASTVLSLVVGTALILSLFVSFSASASAATYAYVDKTGEVKSVVADTWMSAINIAPNIHINSGVLLLKSASDFTIIGDDVKSI